LPRARPHSDPGSRPAGRARSRRAVALALAAFAALVYANTLRNGYTLDDAWLVASNPHVREPDLALLRSPYWHPAFESRLYRPLAIASYALGHRLLGPAAAGQHAINVALHALVSLLALGLARRVTSDAAVALAAAVWFAAHAVHSEAVANVVGRAELLCAAFCLLALLAHARGGERSARRLAAVLGAYALALLCKESAIALPGAILVLEVARRPERAQGAVRAVLGALRRRAPTWAGLLAVTLVYLALRAHVLGERWVASDTSRLDNPLVGLEPGWRALNALAVALRYAWLLLWPARLSYDYSFAAIPLLSSWSDPRVAAVLAAWAALLGLFAWSYRASRTLWFALGFAGVSFSVASNLLVPIGTIMGERLVYLPSFGFCLAAAFCLRRGCAALPPRAGARAFAAIAALIALAHGARAALRNADWQSDARLFLADLESAPGSAKVRMNAALVYLYERGEPAQALAQLDAALAIWPGAARAHVHRAHALALLGRRDEARAVYAALLAQPIEEPSVWNALGFAMVEDDIDPERGVELLERAAAARPGDPHVLDSLGWGYFRLGRLAEARERVARSLAIDASGDSGRRRRAHLAEIERALAAAGGPR
jgi:Tfp pilus assembly protein PilF